MTDFTLETVKQFMLTNGGKVKNHELVTHFKSYLNDPYKKDEMRDKFKTYVNTLATIKVEENEKVLVLKKKFRPDSGAGHSDWDTSRAQSEPPGVQTGMSSRATDKPDGAAMSSRVKSEGNLSASDLRLSTSTLSSVNDNNSLGSAKSNTSLSSGNQEEDATSNMSVMERARHLNRVESETELQQTSFSPLGATRGFNKNYSKKTKDPDGEESSSTEYVALEPIEKEWLVTCSSAEYHPMHQLLSKHPNLAKVRDFTTGHTALHWAAKHGRPEVVKMLVGKPGVHVNQRTNGGYTALHLAAQHGHEEIIELLVQGFKADPNIRDYSGKKAKQYLRNSASSRAQRGFLQLKLYDIETELLVSSRLSSKTGQDNVESGSFVRNAGGRRSNRASAIKSLIKASTSSMRQTVIRSGWGSTEDINNENTTPRSSPSISPRNSAEPSPTQRRRQGSGSRSRERELMPPPNAPMRSKNRRPPHSVSKESLHTEDKKLSTLRQVSRSESEPNLGEATKASKTTFI